MPTPDRTSLPEIVAAGRHLLDAAGLGAVTMAAVAERVGVRAPSLYKRVRNRDELVRLLAEDAARDLGRRLTDVDLDATDARTQLAVLARAVRGFAHARPAAYRLVFAPGEDVGLSRDVLETTAARLFAVVEVLADGRQPLEAARTVTAWVTGFIAMELGGAFRLGGDVDDAFDYGIARIAEAIAGSGR
jgi:AcrR family transcriptional regulator